MQTSIGKTLKSYELQGLVGTGGFGAVYRARQTAVDREVAIKIIWPAFANHPNFIRRFEAEAQLAAGLEHPHIVPIYDYWRDPDGAYIVMRYLRGGHLREALDTRSFSLQEVSRLISQIGAALALAHRFGVVHRDIKPENILLDEEGNGYLADFGIAQIMSNVQSDSPDFVSGMGSPAYAAPEQLIGGTPSPQSDIYSLGVILYELVTGQHPFPQLAELSMTEMNQLRATTALPAISKIRSDLPNGLNDVIQRATTLNPQERFIDPFAMIRALNDALGVAGRSAQGIRAFALNEVIPNPYKGLRAFQETDASYFFGREVLTQRLISRLKETDNYSRFLSVVGPSGSGKSSVVRAGLIPQLRQGALPNSRHWYYDQVILGSNPLQELENVLVGLASQPPYDISQRLISDSHSLVDLVNSILPANNSELVLFIDQFEELFTLVDDERIIQQVIELLFHAVTDPDSRIRIFTTIRADFYDRPLLLPLISDMVRERTEVVVPLTANELERVILEPARRSGISIDVGLVTALVNEVKEQPGALPLLQYTLCELFDRRDGNLITHEAYKEIGGVRGALAKRADEIYLELDELERGAMRQIMLRLINLGEGTEDTRRRVLLSELIALHSGSPELVSVLESVVDRFGQARLLTFDRDPVTRNPTVEVTHEAIIREWGRLRGWLDESRQDMRMQRTLSTLVHEWQDNRFESSYLMRGVRLISYEKWAETTELALTELEFRYLSVSIEERERFKLYERERENREQMLQQRAINRTRWLAGVLFVAVIVSFALTGYASIQSNRANASAQQAQDSLEMARSLAWETGALQALAEENSDLAILLAMQATAIENPAPTSLHTLAGAVFAPATRRVLIGHDASVQDVAISPDQTRVASASTDSTVKVWDSLSGELLYTFSGHSADVESVVFSPDGQYLVSTGADFYAIIWDMTTGAELRRFQTPADPVRRSAFTPDSQQLLTVSNRGQVILWDVASGAVVRRYVGHGSATVLAVAISPDGLTALSGARDGVLILWDLASGAVLNRLIGQVSAVTSVSYDATGVRAVSTYGDGSILIWDVQRGQTSQRFYGTVEDVRDAVFTPDGRYVYSTSISGTIRIWDVRTGLEADHLMGHTDSVLGLAMTPDGQMLATASKDRTIRLWNIGYPGADAILTGGHRGRVTQTLANQAGTVIVSTSIDGQLLLWDVSTQTILQQFTLGEAILSVAWAGNEQALVVGLRSGSMVQLQLSDGEITQRYDGHQGAIEAIQLLPNGTQMISVGLDRIAILWDMTTGEQLQTYQGHRAGINGLAVDGTGTIMVTASSDDVAIIWDIATGAILARLAPSTSTIYDVAFSPDNQMIATGSRDSVIVLWDRETATEISRFSPDIGAIWSLEFSPNGRELLIAGGAGQVVIWDWASANALLSFNTHAIPVFDLQLFGENQIVSGLEDGSLVIWRRYNLDELRQWIAQNRYVRPWTCFEIERYRIPTDACTRETR